MALNRSTSANKPLLNLWMRLIGLTGLVTAFLGGFLWHVLQEEKLGPIVLVTGATIATLALLYEIRGLLQSSSSRRGAFGINVFLQIVLAIATVIIVNALSFQHYRRFDWTREQLFTLPESVRTQLSQLRGTTDIIVLQQYVSFGQSADNKQDKYDLAAQRRIVEKVKDLAEQFQDLGPRFRVQILDIQDDDYLDKIKAIRKESEELAKAIEKAPENSIFFHAPERQQIQRLSFSDIYELDKQASLKANDERGNLVLKFQGVEGFARKIFNIEEKKPHVAMAVIHPWLGLQNREHVMFTMNGAKKVLDAYGFECTDIMLRKLDADGNLTSEPTALSYEESRYEQIEDELVELDESLHRMEDQFKEIETQHRTWSESNLAILNKKFAYVILESGQQGVMTRKQAENLKKTGMRYKLIDVDEDDRKMKITATKRDLEVMDSVMKADREERLKLLKEKSLLRVDRLAEKRRMSDVEEKVKEMLANVDLLIVPRITLLNAPRGMLIPNRVHRLDTAQLKGIKSYLRQGKPALFLLGPSNEPSEMPERDLEGSDQLDPTLEELGFKLPRQTVLYNIEAKEYNERKVGVVFSNREIEVPGLRFDNTTETNLWNKHHQTLRPHPVRTSLNVTSRTAGNQESYEVRVRHPRPVYYLQKTMEPDQVATIAGSLALPGLAGQLQASTVWLNQKTQQPDENAVFLVTREEAWNEDKPFITKNHVPRFLPPSEDDPKKGGVEEARRGPFPIGVAAEITIPSNWYEKGNHREQKARVAVIGSGNVFVGLTLPALKQKMFLDVVNWLLGRDDLLARDAETWEYPRVHMSDTTFSLWEWGTRLGLPILFIYLGIVVWLVRRTR